MSEKRNGIRTYSGAVAIITGGGSGIGRALGLELAERGAAIVAADKNAEAARRTAEEIAATGGKAESAAVDVTDAAAVKSLVDETAARHGRLDYMFNNAGIGVCGEIRDFALDDWNRVLDVNLRGVIHGVQAAYPVMLRQGFGHIVNTSSMGGLLPFPLNASYTASKYAVLALTMSLRIESLHTGVRASALCPGVIRTPILRGEGDNRILFDTSKIPTEEIEGIWRRTRPMDVSAFARKAAAQIARNTPIIVIPWWWKLPWLLNRFFPNLTLSLLRSQFYDVSIRELAARGVDISDHSCPR